MDIFCEYMVKRKRQTKDILLVIGIVLAAIFVSLILVAFLRELSFIPVCGVIYGAWWLITRTNTEFEYILTSTVLDIDKIMAKRSRKRILSIDLKEILSCQAIDGAASENVKVIDVTPNGAEDGVYAVDFEKDGAKTRLMFKPNRKMLAKMKKASPSLVTLRPEDVEE